MPILNQKITKNRVELLAPAGSLEKLKYALHYGADAVYCGVPDFSLRARVNCFSEADLEKAVAYVHDAKKKIYVTLNIYAHQIHLKKIEQHIRFLKKRNVDGIIASDPGILALLKKYWPECEIHLSTQANATNSAAINFWKEQGIKRVILAREVTLDEIKEIGKKVSGIELEYFVHGAMCMSYSGRCILSKWMSGRSANLGDCSQPCRWAYGKAPARENQFLEMDLIDDQKRFGLEVEEDLHGTYFFNSYDMNLIEHIEPLMKAGITSLKIEGRAKSAYYLAVVTRAYRRVIDAIEDGTAASELKKIIQEHKKELDNLINRGYSTGFLLGREPEHNFENRSSGAQYQFVGEIEGIEGELNILRVHNQISILDKLEAITPLGNIPIKIKQLFDDTKKTVTEAHGGHERRSYVKFDRSLNERDLIRSVNCEQN